MIYKPFQDTRLSRLGMGCMRLPIAGEHGPIDVKKADEMFELAYSSGINYFDTAYRYHGGESETVTGRALARYPRDTWHIASKMPGHQMTYENGKIGFTGYLTGHAPASLSDIFEEQLEKCRVDYFDFYLLHNMCETSYDFYTNEELGVVDYLLEQKKAGRIRHLGFSTHGGVDVLRRFLDWRDCFEFAQIQLNYLDWDLQNAGAKYELLASRGIPVVVMEPCRGGRLASLGQEQDARLLAARPGDSVASWAFRFLKALPGVQVVLSGMSSMEQLQDNLATFADDSVLSDPETAILKQAYTSLLSLVPCTGCRYCCDACPQGLDIPKLISLWNESTFGRTAGLKWSVMGLKPEESSANCLGCGQCAKLCPQNIDIPDILAKMAVLEKELLA